MSIFSDIYNRIFRKRLPSGVERKQESYTDLRSI